MCPPVDKISWRDVFPHWRQAAMFVFKKNGEGSFVIPEYPPRPPTPTPDQNIYQTCTHFCKKNDVFFNGRREFAKSRDFLGISPRNLDKRYNFACIVHPKKYAHGFCFAVLCCGYTLIDFPYPSGLLHWHCGNLTIAPVPAKQPWWIWINTSCEFIMNDYITTTKQSTTKPCAYLLYLFPFVSSACLNCLIQLLLLSPKGYFISYKEKNAFCFKEGFYWEYACLDIRKITVYPKKYAHVFCALLCCGYAIAHNEFTWSIYPYSSGLLCWHWGNR